MADIDRINLTAEPAAISEGEKSTITATVLDNAGVGIKGAEVQFDVSAGGKVTPTTGKTKKEDGVVTTELTAETGSGVKTIQITATSGGKQGQTNVQINAIGGALAQKQRDLATAQDQLNKYTRNAEDKKKEIEKLKQDIDALRKVVQTPAEITNTVNEYKKVFDTHKQKLADLQPAIKPIEDAITAKLNDKAKLTEIAGKRTRFDQEVTALKNALDQIDKSIADLREVKIKDAVKLCDSKKADYDKVQKTQAKVTDGLKRLGELKTQAETAKGTPTEAAYAYLAVLDAKDKLTAVQGLLIEANALEKKLTDAWKQVETQSEAVTALAAELEQKKTERAALEKKLADKGITLPEPDTETTNATRETELRAFIDGMNLG